MAYSELPKVGSESFYLKIFYKWGTVIGLFPWNLQRNSVANISQKITSTLFIIIGLISIKYSTVLKESIKLSEVCFLVSLIINIEISLLSAIYGLSYNRAAWKYIFEILNEERAETGVFVMAKDWRYWIIFGTMTARTITSIFYLYIFFSWNRLVHECVILISSFQYNFVLLSIIELTNIMLVKQTNLLSEIKQVSFNYNPFILIHIKKIKKVYKYLFILTQKVNQVFGIWFLVSLTNCFIEYMYDVNLLIDLVVLRQSSEFFLTMIRKITDISILTVIIVMSCDKVEKGAIRLAKLCNTLRASVQDPILAEELDGLSIFIRKLRLKFTVYGFFTINQQTIPVFISALATYLIILVQFKV